MRNRNNLLLLGILFIAAAFRFPGLGRESLWGDEITRVIVGTKPTIPEVINAVQRPHSAGYPIFLHFWTKVGRGEEWLRLPSAIAGVVSVWLLFLFGKRTGGVSVGFIAALLLAVSASHIRFSRETASYGVQSAVIVGLAYLWLRAMAKGAWRSWTGFAGLAAISHYLHPLASTTPIGLFLLAPIVWVIGPQRTHTSCEGQSESFSPMKWAVSLAMYAILILPQAVDNFSGSRQFIGSSGETLTVKDFSDEVLRLFGGVWTDWGWTSYVVLPFIPVGAAVLLFRNWVLGIAVIGWASGSIAIWAAFASARTTFFDYHYLLSHLPALLLLAALGIKTFASILALILEKPSSHAHTEKSSLPTPAEGSSSHAHTEKSSLPMPAEGSSSHALLKKPSPRTPLPEGEGRASSSGKSQIDSILSILFAVVVAGTMIPSALAEWNRRWPQYREAGAFLVERMRPEDRYYIKPERYLGFKLNYYCPDAEDQEVGLEMFFDRGAQKALEEAGGKLYIATRQPLPEHKEYEFQAFHGVTISWRDPMVYSEDVFRTDYHRIRSGGRPPRPLDLFNHAQELAEAGLWDEACRVIIEAASGMPEFYPVLRTKAKILRDAGRDLDAIQAFEVAHRHAPTEDRWWMWVEIAKIHTQRGEHQQSLEHYFRALEEPKTKKAYLWEQIGEAEMELGNLKKAEEAFRQSLQHHRGRHVPTLRLRRIEKMKGEGE